MYKSKVFFNLIELSPRLEQDLSYFVLDYSVENGMSESSFVTPLGVSSANTAGVTLSNVDGRFANDNEYLNRSASDHSYTYVEGQSSIPNLYKGLLDKNVEFRLSVGINTGSYESPNWEYVRQFTMKTDTWEGQDLDRTSVSLFDDAMRLQTIKPNPIFFQSMTVGEIIWRLLDSVGFNNYKYESRDDDPSTLIPYFWADGEKTIWEIINELAHLRRRRYTSMNITYCKSKLAMLHMIYLGL